MKRNKEAFQREIKNEYVELNLKSTFDHAMIEQMMDPRHDYSDKGTEHLQVYVIVDPAAGGVSSRYAIISLACVKVATRENKYVQTHMVVCTLLLFFLFMLPTIPNFIVQCV
jgi:hypothetical protein